MESKREGLCTGKMMLEEWSMISQSNTKLLKVIKNDLRNKKKTSAEYLYFLDLEGEISEDEICKAVEKKIKDESGLCNPDASTYHQLLSKNVLSMSLDEACRYMVPAVKKARSDCLKELGREGEIHREPPGEEISPAEDPAPQSKSFFSDKGKPQESETIQKASVKKAKGSSSSAQ